MIHCHSFSKFFPILILKVWSENLKLYLLFGPNGCNVKAPNNFEMDCILPKRIIIQVSNLIQICNITQIENNVVSLFYLIYSAK